MVSRALKAVKGGKDYDFMHQRGMFVKIYELALLIRLAKHDPMAAEVLTWLIYRMDSHNRATMVMLAMAEDLKCHRTTIKRKLDRLVALNFIQRGRYRGETVVDVNPLLCNRTNTMYHYFQPPIELPTEDELDAYFAQFKKTPEFECDLETGEIHE